MKVSLSQCNHFYIFSFMTFNHLPFYLTENDNITKAYYTSFESFRTVLLPSQSSQMPKTYLYCNIHFNACLLTSQNL